MLRDEVKNILIEAVGKAGLSVEEKDLVIEHPLVKEYGDFATNIAMRLAKAEKKPPMQVADLIIQNFPKSELIEKVEAVQPGFINITLSPRALGEEIKNILTSKNRYGAPAHDRKRILIEHTQINPNKAPHIGHLRNVCIGDSLVRLYDFAGFDAKALYYQNDVGQQISSIVLAYKKQFIKKEDFPSVITWASQAYADMEKRMEEDEEIKKEKEALQVRIAEQNNEDSELAQELTTQILKETFELLSHLGVEYDLIVKESDILKKKLWEKAFQLLKSNDAFYLEKEGERAGCWMIKMPNAEDKVIVRSNGIPTYAGNDIANHLWKFGILDDFLYKSVDWGFQQKDLYETSSDEGEENKDFHGADAIVNVIDQTQTYPQQSVIESLRILGYEKEADNYHHVNYGFVYLSKNTAEKLGIEVEEGAKQVKISGRKGSVVSVKNFLDRMEAVLKEQHGNFETIKEVRNGAIKFELLKYNTYQDIIFDLDSALDLKGFSGPYLQYAYTRIASVLRKYEGEIGEVDASPEDSEKEFLRLLYRFPEAVKSALEENAPHHICLFLFELAQAWNAFYAENRIIGSDREKERVAIAMAAAQVFKNGFYLLGISAPESM